LSLIGGLGLVPSPGKFATAADTPSDGTTAPIATRPIPRTGERLPVIGLGTAWVWAANQPARQETIEEVVRALVTGGGSVIDSASVYGQAEKMLGAALADTGLRSRVFIATKLETDQLSQDGMQGSLRRLQTSKIDLMQVHNVVRSSGQSFAQLRDWKAQGLVRYIGMTTSTTREFGAFEAVMRRERPDFIEVNYWLGERDAEQRLLPAAVELGIATLIDRPFGGFESPRGNLWHTVQGQPLPDWAREFDAASWAQFFLKYLIGNSAVTVVIPGTDKSAHMADNLGAGRGRLPDAATRQRMAQFIDALG